MIRVENLRKSYGGRLVLDVPQCTFEAGGRYALIGANGSGKSTLLRVLAGVLEPDEGAVLRSPEAAGLGYMPQQPYAFGFSVLKNVTIAFPDQRQGRQAALDALGRVELESFAEASGSRLSGGETQRMALARMIALPRPLLLLDEPTSATDIAGNDCVERVLLEYCARHGAAMIFATHSLAQAQRLAERVIMLEQGRIAESGPVDQVLRDPQSPEARRFLRYWRLD